ncbi:phage integrase N-terminal domain-containing protein [Pleionea sp. CnH1-48]|uniref:phage integrase N-terminal domain-containing protein n=1 Tax=Pleionea sp. CnH1-48 TaxID=2954494 RepID=UPI002097B61A|nr:phage integrase N-terminal domain-containing protein [Pleionea sp. CnH1-48]MCO7225065.1 integrase domain-containing protein [Pleionea sp. CnH1-48]
MKDIVSDFIQLCNRNKDGSFDTQAKRVRELKAMGELLVGELGFRKMRARSIKPKHVIALVEHWKAQGIAVSTIKTRMSYVRWWARKKDRQGVVYKTNAQYGISNRQYVTNESKAWRLDESKLEGVKSEHVRISIKLAAVFGLRTEEVLKIQPGIADQGCELWLKASWCKGGKQRFVPIRTEQQRDILNEAKAIAGKGSLIPPSKSYSQHRRHYYYALRTVGLIKPHGLRHQYAQDRYFELAGWHCPVMGGPRRKELTREQKQIDQRARKELALELGHERINVVANYIGV